MWAEKLGSEVFGLEKKLRGNLMRLAKVSMNLYRPLSMTVSWMSSRFQYRLIQRFDLSTKHLPQAVAKRSVLRDGEAARTEPLNRRFYGRNEIVSRPVDHPRMSMGKL